MRGLSASGQLAGGRAPTGAQEPSGVYHTGGYLLCTLPGAGLAWLDNQGAQARGSTAGNAGRVVLAPVEGDGTASWAHAD